MPRRLLIAGLMSRRRSRCAAVAVAAGKRCTPGRGDLGVCNSAFRHHPLHAPRRLNKTLRAVCRLWGRGLARSELVN